MSRAEHFVVGAGSAQHALSFRHVNDSGEHSIIAEHAGQHVGEPRMTKPASWVRWR